MVFAAVIWMFGTAVGQCRSRVQSLKRPPIKVTSEINSRKHETTTPASILDSTYREIDERL